MERKNRAPKKSIKVFVTYCWFPEAHQEKVCDFVDRLRENNFAAEQDLDILERENNLQKMMTSKNDDYWLRIRQSSCCII